MIHYGSRAVGKVGLIILEATAVEKRGRLSGRDLGIWEDSQIEGLRRVVEICRAHGSVVGIQLAHAGRKAWGDELVAPSAIAFPGFAVPHALSRAEIAEVVESWRQAARNQSRFMSADSTPPRLLIHEFLSL